MNIKFMGTKIKRFFEIHKFSEDYFLLFKKRKKVSRITSAPC